MHQQPFYDLFLYVGFVYDVFFWFFPARHFFQLTKTSGEVVEGGWIEARTSVWLDKQWCLKNLTANPLQRQSSFSIEAFMHNEGS